MRLDSWLPFMRYSDAVRF